MVMTMSKLAALEKTIKPSEVARINALQKPAPVCRPESGIRLPNQYTAKMVSRPQIAGPNRADHSDTPNTR
jgi:hypothetical protein